MKNKERHRDSLTFSLSYLKGIHVSTWRGKSINWKKVKSSGIHFAILCAIYIGKKTGIVVCDDTFDINYKNAKLVGVKLGLYWYSYTKIQKEGEKEALACINIIKGKKFEWPIYVDIEDKD